VGLLGRWESQGHLLGHFGRWDLRLDKCDGGLLRSSGGTVDWDSWDRGTV